MDLRGKKKNQILIQVFWLGRFWWKFSVEKFPTEGNSTDKSARKSRAGWSEVVAAILWPRPGLHGEEQKLWGQVRWAGHWVLERPALVEREHLQVPGESKHERMERLESFSKESYKLAYVLCWWKLKRKGQSRCCWKGKSVGTMIRKVGPFSSHTESLTLTGLPWW